MFSAAKAMSNSASLSTDDQAPSCVSSGTRVQSFGGLFNNPVVPINIVSTFNNNNNHHHHDQDHQQPQKIKKKRSLPGNPDPDAEVIALSPKTLLATNRFVCEICNKGFQRDQNLQLHRRGHNLPWKLKQRSSKEQVKKRAYVCPEPTCVHHHPSRALGDLTGIKKHFCRKHGEKKWKCDKCSKIYAVQSDWKAHSKTCGTREYRCDCGTLFSRKDSFITHRAFCDALAEESARLSNYGQTPNSSSLLTIQPLFPNFPSHISSSHPHLIMPSNTHINAFSPWDPPPPPPQNPSPSPNPNPIAVKPEAGGGAAHDRHIRRSLADHFQLPPAPAAAAPSPHLSATALLQKAATVGAQQAQAAGHAAGLAGAAQHVLATWQRSSDSLTRDFLGLTAADHNHHANYNHHHHHHHHHHHNHSCGGGGGEVDVSVGVKEVLGYAGGGGAAELAALKQTPSFGFAEAEAWSDC